MTTGISRAPPRLNAAVLAATDHYRCNLAELRNRPRLGDAQCWPVFELEYVYSRDGSLSALDEAGRWWSGCSLPMRAQAAMLANLKVTGRVVCLLAPPHAATVRVALDKIGPRRAIIVLVPDSRELRVLLACDDFSAEIRERRLWFASGPNGRRA